MGVLAGRIAQAARRATQGGIGSALEEILIAILRGLFEFIVETLSYGGFDGLDWPSGRSSAGRGSKAVSCIVHFLVGCAVAGVSLLFVRRTFLSAPAVRIANLVIAPIASAYVSQVIGFLRARRDPLRAPKNRFWQAYWFTFGLVLIRFTYALRN